MLRFIDSFDGYTTAADLTARGWTGFPIVSAGNGRRGTASGRAQSSNTLIHADFPTAHATWIIGFAYRINSLAVNNGVVSLTDSTQYQSAVAINPSGNLVIRRGNPTGGTLLGTSTQALLPNTYYYIEFKCTISNSISANTCVLRVDGVEWLNLAAGTDTQNTANATANGFQLSSGGGGINDFDDLYVADGSAGQITDFIGDCRVDCLFPNADGSNSNFTLSTGTSHFAVVDETTPNGDTDYMESSTAAHRDSWNFANLPTITNASIKGVQLSLNARKDDAGARSIKNLVKSGATTNVGSAQALSTTYVYYHSLYETDPNTAAAWTEANFNAAEFGLENV